MPHRRLLLRFAVLVVAVVGLAVTVLLVPLRAPQDWVDLAAQTHQWAPLWAVLGTALLACALVPRAVLAVAAGVLFGPLIGTAVALTGVGIGALASFAAGRWLGRELVLAVPRAAAADRWVRNRGLLGVVVARLLPVAPFGLVSYGYGVTGIPAVVFWSGTVLGAAPSTIVYAHLGAATLSPSSPGFVISLVAALTLGLTGTAASHRFSRHREVPVRATRQTARSPFWSGSGSPCTPASDSGSR